MCLPLSAQAYKCMMASSWGFRSASSYYKLTTMKYFKTITCLSLLTSISLFHWIVHREMRYYRSCLNSVRGKSFGDCLQKSSEFRCVPNEPNWFFSPDFPNVVLNKLNIWKLVFKYTRDSYLFQPPMMFLIIMTNGIFCISPLSTNLIPGWHDSWASTLKQNQWSSMPYGSTSRWGTLHQVFIWSIEWWRLIKADDT